MYAAERAERLLEDKDNALTTKYWRLEKLCKWEHVDKVNQMLLSSDLSPGAVAKWCRENDFFISNPKMYEYKELLMKAIAKRTTVDTLLGIGKPKGIRKAILLPEEVLEKTATKVKNELEVLDLIIQRGFDTIASSPAGVKIGDALRAIDLKNKITDGMHGGMTQWGLEQLRALEEAKFNAVLAVIKDYVPEDKWELLDESIQQAEYLFYQENAPEYLNDYEEVVGKEET